MPVGITYFVAGNQYYNSFAVAAKGSKYILFKFIFFFIFLLVSLLLTYYLLSNS